MKSAKMLLIGPKLTHRAFKGGNQALPWLASTLNNAGYKNVKQIDMENKNNTLEALLKYVETADFIAFSGSFNLQLEQIYQHATKIKEYLRKIGKDTPIVLGGYGAAGVDRYAAHAPFIDAFHYGSGLEAIVKIAEATEKGRFREALRNKEIPGLSYYDQEKKEFVRGTPVPQPSEEMLGSIDQLFERDYIPEIHDMGDIFFEKKNGLLVPLQTFQLVTETGCPWFCAFCSESGNEKEQMFMGRKVTEIPLESIEWQLDKAESLGYKAFYLDIETAMRNWDRLEKILGMAHERGMVTGLNTRLDTVTEERIKRCKELGVVYQFFGVEHLKPEVLIAIDKFAQIGIDKKLKAAEYYRNQAGKVFEWMNKYDVGGSLFLIAGLPKITEESLEKARRGEIKEHEMIYVPTTLEDDIYAIREGFKRCNPRFFNMNILRFNPDTSMAIQDRYASIRPTGKKPIDAMHFDPRVYPTISYEAQEYNPLFRFFEGVERNQPYTTAMTPDRGYITIQEILEQANKYGTFVYYDPILEKTGLITRKNKIYKLKGTIKDFERELRDTA